MLTRRHPLLPAAFLTGLAILIACAHTGQSAPPSNPANLTRSTIIEVVGDVTIINPTGQTKRTPKANDVFTTPEIMRTGPNSRAELVAEDKTVTRVGANTVFSFEPNKREINLQQGSVLFNSPSGKGGGTIKTASATAAVLGTTLIVAAGSSGGFKVLMMEGSGQVTAGNGASSAVKAGQMSFVLPGQKGLSPTYNFQLKQQTSTSKLIRGFKAPLASIAKVEAAASKQSKQIAKGDMVETKLLASDEPGVAFVANASAAIETVISANRPTAEDVTVTTPQPDSQYIVDGFGSNGTFFFAHNLTFKTPTFDSGGLLYLATKDIIFDGSMSVTGGGPLTLFAGGAFSNTPGTRVDTNNELTLLTARGSELPEDFDAEAIVSTISGPSASILTDFALVNNIGSVTVNAPVLNLDNAGLWATRDLTINAGSLSLNNHTTALESWAAPTDGELSFDSETPVANTTFSNLGTGLEAGGTLTVRAASNFTAVRCDFVAENARISSGGNMSLQSVRFSNRDFDADRGAVSIAAAGTLDINGARFQVKTVDISGSTVNLQDVNFAEGSFVRLRSQLGRVNLEGDKRTGYVNVLNDVYYGGNDIGHELGRGGASRVRVTPR